MKTTKAKVPTTKAKSSFAKTKSRPPVGMAKPQPGIFRVAAIQMSSGPNVSANLSEAERLIGMAAEQGAKLVALPEYFCIMGMKETDKVAVREVVGKGVIQKFLARMAKTHKVWLVGGSVPLETDSDAKVFNSCLVYDDKGKQVARYDKIHLFGLDLGNEHYREEKTIQAGKKVVVVDTPFGRIGLFVMTCASRNSTGQWARWI
jgi:predicted amidohydrolase